MKGSIDFSTYLNEYAFKAPYEVEHRESGMNNTTRIIRSGQERFVLRIYNNHKDANIVRLEHEVLAALQERRPPFQVPVPVRSKRGDTVCVAADGTLSALFHYIEGDRPNPENPFHVYELGRTAALLTAALGGIKPAGKPLYSPYYELESTYAAMDENAFLSIADRSKALASRRSSFLLLHKERMAVKEECEAVSRLPKQWIHGDLVFNNTVSQGDEIIGVLDFEFSTIDVRAMELAVIIVDLLKPDEPDCGMKAKRLLEGYRNTFRLTGEELEKLPVLMKLRLLDVALHFAIRLRDGLDGEEVMCGIMDQSAFGCCWINENWEEICR